MSKFYEDVDGKVIVTTSRGHRLECKPVLTMLDGIKETEQAKAEVEFGLPPPVTYTVTDVTGDTEEFEHDKESIKDPKTPEEDREQWKERERISAEIEAVVDARSNKRIMRIIATRGVIMLDMPREKSWIEEHEWLGYTVPKHKRARLYHYFNKEVIGTIEDGVRIMAGITAASGFDKEVLARVEAGFRAKVGEEGRPDAAPTEETPAGGAEEGRVVEQPVVDDSGDDG